MRVGHYIMTSPTHHHFIWHPESLCGMSRNQLTSTVSGENPGSRPRWWMHTSWTTPQPDNWALLFLDNNGLSWTVSAPDKVTAVPVRRNGNFQTPISVPVVRPKRCHTLSNPAHRQDYTVACLNYTLQTMMPLSGWPVMAPNAYDNNNIRSTMFCWYIYVVLSLNILQHLTTHLTSVVYNFKGICPSVCMYVCLSDDRFWKSGHRRLIFAHPVYLQGIRVKFVCEGQC